MNSDDKGAVWIVGIIGAVIIAAMISAAWSDIATAKAKAPCICQSDR